MSKRRLAAVLLLFALLSGQVRLHAQTMQLEDQLPFETDAVSVLLMDVHTGTMIYEQNIDEKRPVASITKLMTMLLVMEAIEKGDIALSQKVSVSKEAAGMGGSQALLEAGGEYAVEELLKSLIVASANDSAVALAELISGSEDAFAEKMNERAEQLGLHATHYVNASGLPASGQFTSARDVAELSKEVLSHPIYFKYSKIWMDEILHPGGRVTELVNTNRLIRFYDGADGVKTGSTNEAGFCISATARRGEDRFLAVVLGSSTGKARFALAQKLLDHAFDHYTVVNLLKRGETVSQTIRIKGGEEESAAPAAAEDLYVLVKKGEESKAEINLLLNETLHAPVREGTNAGEAQAIVDGNLVCTVPLVMNRNIDKKGFFSALSGIFSGWMKEYDPQNLEEK